MILCRRCGEWKEVERFRRLPKKSAVSVCVDCEKAEAKLRSKRRAERNGREYRERHDTDTMRLRNEGLKKCRLCKTIKPLEGFYKNRASYDGYKQECKECQKRLPRVSLKVKAIPCMTCGEMFYSRYRARYCSRKCYPTNSTVNGFCIYCGNNFIGFFGQKYCDNRCRLSKERQKYRDNEKYRQAKLESSRQRHKQDRSKMLARKHKRKAKIKQQHDGTVNTEVLRSILSERKTCTYCGSRLHEKDKEIDHMDPICLGGLHTKSNLIVCCHACNQLKKGKPFRVWLKYISKDRIAVVKKIYERRQRRVIEQEPLRLTYSS